MDNCQEDNASELKGHPDRYRELNEIEILEWPAQSPDLNPIESAWREIETDLGGIRGRASDVEALKLYIENTWRYHITEEILDRLVDSTPARLQSLMLEDTRNHINGGGDGWRRGYCYYSSGGGQDFLQSIECIHYHSLVSLHLAWCLLALIRCM